MFDSPDALTQEKPRSTSTVRHVAVMDGMRGIAILWVVWYHFYGLSALAPAINIGSMRLDFTFLAQSGYLGVYLFLFLSGFVLYYPYARSIFEGSPPPSIATYTYRRAIKILPSFYLSLILIVGLGRWLFFPSTDELHQFLTHLFFVYNFETSGIQAINPVYWSLAIEVQFYLLFPFMIKVFAKAPWMTAAVISAIAIAYRFWTTACCETADAFLRYQVPAYLDYYVLGMLCAHVFVQARSTSPPWSRRPDWATVMALVFATSVIIMLRSYFSDYSPGSLPTSNHPEHLFYLSLAFFGLSLSTLFANKTWQLIVANRVLLFFSVISYNLYLYHLVVAASLAVRLRFPPLHASQPSADPGWQISFNVVALSIVVAISSVATYFVERPLLRMQPVELWAALRRVFRAGSSWAGPRNSGHTK